MAVDLNNERINIHKVKTSIFVKKLQVREKKAFRVDRVEIIVTEET